MGFKKTTALALSLVTASMLLTSCAPNKDAVIATVDGENIYRWELDILYDQNYELYEAQRGFDLNSAKYKQERIDYRQYLAERLTGELACLQEARELGLDKLTEEEIAECDAYYQSEHDRAVAEFAKEFSTDKDPMARAEEKWVKSMQDKNLTEEKVKQNIYNNAILQKLFDMLAVDHVITDEEVRAKYEDMLAAQQASYAEDLTLFGQQTSGVICYVPEGYIRVKHILVGHDDAKLAQLQQQQEQVNQLYSLWAQTAILDGDTSGSAERAAKDLDVADKALTKDVEDSLASLKPRADEAYSKAVSGEDFDALIEQYNTDPGMVQLPGRRDGYYMCAGSNFVQEFKDAAFALENVGDISAITKSFYGYHIIKLLEKVESRIVPYEEVEERIRFELQGNRNIDVGMEITLKLVDKREVAYFPENY